MRALLNIGVILCGCLAFLAACSEDDSHFPSAVQDFFVAYTASDSTISTIETDDGKRLTVLENKSDYTGTPDSAYRCLGYYELKDGGVKLYTAKNVMSKKPHVLPHPDSLRTDPVQVVSIWKTPRYLNMRLAVLHGDKKHHFDFVEDSINQPSPDGPADIWISLYHDALADMQAFTDFVYASLPLASYQETYPKHTVHFTVNTYEEGPVLFEFYYNQ